MHFSYIKYLHVSSVSHRLESSKVRNGFLHWKFMLHFRLFSTVSVKLICYSVSESVLFPLVLCIVHAVSDCSVFISFVAQIFLTIALCIGSCILVLSNAIVFLVLPYFMEGASSLIIQSLS